MPPRPRRRRPRGYIERLPSGNYRAVVYAGVDLIDRQAAVPPRDAQDRGRRTVRDDPDAAPGRRGQAAEVVHYRSTGHGAVARRGWRPASLTPSCWRGTTPGYSGSGVSPNGSSCGPHDCTRCGNTRRRSSSPLAWTWPSLSGNPEGTCRAPARPEGHRGPPTERRKQCVAEPRSPLTEGTRVVGAELDHGCKTLLPVAASAMCHPEP